MIDKVCSNCQSEKLYIDRIEVFGYNTNRFYRMDVRVCLDCGFVESFVPKEDLGKFKK